MNGTAPTARPDRPARPGPPPLSTTASITTFGTAVWVGAVWAVAAVVFSAILVVIAVAGGQLDASLWHQLGAGWQRWLAALVGYTLVTEFGRMLVTNGVTRAQLARSALVTLVAFAVAGATYATLGYALEGVAFDLDGDWAQRLGDDGPLLGGLGDHARIFVDVGTTLAAFSTTGWLVGACYRSRPRDEANLFLLPCLLPAAAAQLLVRGDTTLFGFLDNLYLDPPVALGLAATLAVTAAGIAAAFRVTRAYVP